MNKLIKKVILGALSLTMVMSFYIPTIATAPTIIYNFNGEERTFTREEFIEAKMTTVPSELLYSRTGVSMVEGTRRNFGETFDKILREQLREQRFLTEGRPTKEEIIASLDINNLEELIENAPTVSETRSSITLQERRLTEEELQNWIEEYYYLGGPNDFELEVVRLINIERAKEGLDPLKISPELMKGARFKSQEMMDLQYFAHSSPVYGGPVGITSLFGHEYPRTNFRVGENLGFGQMSPNGIVNGWLNSPGHRRPIMDPDTRSIGIGRIATTTTANFGY